MRNLQRQLIYRVHLAPTVTFANIVPLSQHRTLSIWQFSHGASGEAPTKGKHGVMLTLSALIGRNTDAIRGLVHRNMGRGLLGWLVKVIRSVSFHCKPSTVRQIGFFVSRLKSLYRTQGEKGTTLYLKSCQVLLQQSTAGYKVSDITELKCRVSRTRAGMPRIIPRQVRQRIRQGDLQSLRLWMTLLGWYRISQFRGMLSLSTITDPGVPVLPLEPWNRFLNESFMPMLKDQFIGKKRAELSHPQPFPIIKSGPTTGNQGKTDTYVSSSFYSLVKSAKLWDVDPLRPTLNRFLKAFASFKGLALSPILQRMAWASGNNWHYQDVKGYPKDSHFGDAPGYLAKLGFKEEAAGKVRVFAMVDPWTQWIMAPLHELIFSILRRLPSDGTFDQPKPVELLRSLNPRGRWYYSIDLSAATDRLPVALQTPLVRCLFEWVGFPNPEQSAQDWADLLVKRPYLVKVPSKSKRGFDIPNDLPESVTYSVGQPMGALSSWAMLALTHHAIVCWAALRAYLKHRANSRVTIVRSGIISGKVPIPFLDYAVLGDDIVIANKWVAQEYLLILSEIGVKAGLAKSIVSKGKFVVEFAKKFFVPLGRADMIPFKEIIATLSSTLLTCEFVRQHKLSLGQILTILGYGYRSKSRALQALYSDLPKRLRTLLIWFRSPKGCFPLNSAEWLRSSGFSSEWDLPEGDSMVWWYCHSAIMSEVQHQLNRYYKAATAYKKAIEITGKLREPFEPFSGKPISYHPSHLTEVLVRNDSLNQFFTEQVPFSALLAPIEFDIHHSDLDRVDTVGAGFSGVIARWLGIKADTTEFNTRYGVSDYVDVPVAELPLSLREFHLHKQVQLINTSPISYDIKCYRLLDWLFAYDDVASEIPTDYWPQLRVHEKPVREFLMVTKWHDDFTRCFTSMKISPRKQSDRTDVNSGNTLVVSPASKAFIEPPMMDTYTEKYEFPSLGRRPMKIQYSWNFQWQQPRGVNHLHGNQWYDYLETCWRAKYGVPQTHGSVSLRNLDDTALRQYHWGSKGDPV